MLAYWLARGWLVAFGPEEQVATRLRDDEFVLQRLRLLARLLFFQGMELGPH